jgi:vitamin B12 transporter
MKKSIRLNARGFAPALSVLSLAVAASVQAQTSDSGQVVITAARQEQRANESIASLTVIDREMIDQFGSSTLGEVLSRSAGVEFNRQGSQGSAESVFIRGANGGHTLVLIDGIRIGSASLGTTAVEAIPLEQVERIEILRGPGSALYGSDAIGGVVNVITQTNHSNTPTVTGAVGAGTNGTYTTHVGLNQRDERTVYRLVAGVSGSDGFNSLVTATNPAYNADRDGYSNRNFGVNVTHEVNSVLEVGAGAMNTRSESRYDAYQLDQLWQKVNGRLDYKRTHELSQASAYATVKPQENWTSTLRVADATDADEQLSSSVGGANDRYKTTQKQYSFQNDVKLPIGKALLLVEHVEQTLSSNNTYSLYERAVDSYAAGWSGRVDKSSFQFNLRQDKNSQYGTKDSQYFGYGYQLTQAWGVAASYGTSFKAPSFNDLYFPVTPGVGGGNPNLKPENATSREVSLRYESGQVQGYLTHFDNRISNLIQWADDGTGAWYPTNVASARIKGEELGGAIRNRSWLYKANLTFQNPIDTSTGARLMSRAKQYATVSSIYSNDQYKLGSELRLVGSRYYDPSTPTRMAGYSLVNLFAEYRLNSDWKLFGRIDNLLNKNYELAHVSTPPVAVYGVPGRTLFVGLRYAVK